jgi:hypothetical protein
MDGHRDNVISIRTRPLSEQLEALARKPFALHREILLDLAERFRWIEALEDHGHAHDHQLEFGEAA